MLKVPKTLTGEEIAAIERVIMDYGSSKQKELTACRNYLGIMLMLEAGLRIGEMTQLVWSDLTFDGVPVLTLRVRPEIAKNKKERMVPVSGKLTIAIQWFYRLKFTAYIPNGSRPVFASSRTGLNITPRQWQRILDSYAIKAIGRQVNPHMLRHTFATRLMRVTSMPVVQQLLGHSSIKTTQIYTHPNGDDLSKAIDQM